MEYYDNPDWEALTEKLFRLPPEITRVSQICQVDEQLVRKIRRIGKPTKTIQNERKIDKLIRFFNALAIYDLIMEKPLVSVSSGKKIFKTIQIFRCNFERLPQTFQLAIK